MDPLGEEGLQEAPEEVEELQRHRVVVVEEVGLQQREVEGVEGEVGQGLIFQGVVGEGQLQQLVEEEGACLGRRDRTFTPWHQMSRIL